MMTAVMLGLVGLLMVWIRKTAQGQEELWQRLHSISPTSGSICVAADTGKVHLSGGAFWLEGPHGLAGPKLSFQVVPGTVESYPYHHFDGSVSEEKRVKGGGFDITFDTPTAPDMPLPPRIRLEFRDDTLVIRTWRAKVDSAEWQVGDGY